MLRSLFVQSRARGTDDFTDAHHWHVLMAQLSHLCMGLTYHLIRQFPHRRRSVLSPALVQPLVKPHGKRIMTGVRVQRDMRSTACRGTGQATLKHSRR